MSYENEVQQAWRQLGPLGEREACEIVRKADVQIAALTERLRIVEAERDASAQQFRAELQQMSDSGYKMRDEYESKLSDLCAELQRKDAALKEACAIADRAIRAGYQASGGAIVQKDLGRDELEKCRCDLNAAIQPKDKP